MRDALSLLDQAIAHAAGSVQAEHVRQMLGLADRARVIDLFEALMRGDIAAALTELRAQYDIGAEPAVVLSDLAEFTHFVTRVKVVPAVADDPSLIEIERARGRACAEKLSMRVLSRTWQMLLKGIAEVAAAGRPLAAAEMVLVRIAYAADLPTPEDVIRSLDDNGQAARAQGSAPAAAPAGAASAPRFEMPRVEPSRAETTHGGPRAALAPASDPSARMSAPEPTPPALVVGRFEDLIALAAQKRDLGVKLALERDVRLVRCEDGRLEIGLQQSAAKTLVNDLARKFTQWTNRRWMVVVSAEQGEATVRSQNEARQAELKTGVRADPLVQAVLARFPGAEIVDVRKGEMPLAPPPDDAGDGPELAADEGRSGFDDDGRPADAEDDH